ncbi:endonuclease III [Ignatzschineria larvae DSM 13226]|uniref:Endonuclease III n=2 Tax=Ignatzschineria larvae TaxID=112009 RepID=A0ABZ3BZW0_9GAMM|nr:endonuclease III [Ignatzschineria larvae]
MTDAEKKSSTTQKVTTQNEASPKTKRSTKKASSTKSDSAKKSTAKKTIAKKRPVKKSTAQKLYQRLMTKDEIEAFFTILQRENPHPTTELNYSSTFELLVAVLLSAQSTDVGVNKATVHLFKAANKPDTMYALGEEKIRDYIKTLGLYNGKAANLYQTCHILATQYNNEVPDTREALEALPGVGRKTANVILNTAFRQPTMAVDTHIFRLSNRTGLAPGKDVLEVEQELLKRIPKPFLLDAHHWLILHGRYTCVARKPRCGACVVYDQCQFLEKTE